MKKLILLLFILLSLFPAIAAAMGSPQSTNPNGPNYVPPAPALSNPKVQEIITLKKAKLNIFSGMNILGEVQKSIITAGPKLAGRLHNISGEIFGILTVLAFIWLVMPMWFKGMDFGAIVMFWVKVLIIYGMLREYNYFWNEGIVGFFIYLKTQIMGAHTEMITFTFEVFAKILWAILESFVGGSVWAVITGGWPLAGILLLDVATLLMLFIAIIMIIGTIFLVQIYIVIALVTGYIFIPFAVIKQGEFLFNGWLKFLISSAFSYFLIGLVMKLFEVIFSSITYDPSLGQMLSLGEQLGVLIVLILFAYLITKIPSLAGELIAGTPNISVSGAVAGAMGAVSIMAGAGRIAGAAATGGTSELAAQGAKLAKHWTKVKDFKGIRGAFKNKGGDKN